MHLGRSVRNIDAFQDPDTKGGVAAFVLSIISSYYSSHAFGLIFAVLDFGVKIIGQRKLFEYLWGDSNEHE